MLPAFSMSRKGIGLVDFYGRPVSVAHANNQRQPRDRRGQQEHSNRQRMQNLQNL